MKLTYNGGTRQFELRLGRGDPRPTDLMLEYGLDFSYRASTFYEALLHTPHAYAAASFWEHADETAKAQLGKIIVEIEASWRSEGTGHYPMPPDRELWPFQVADLDYGRRRSHWLDGDEPGLGKTPTAIVYANELQAERVLVILPASIRLQWVERIQQWSWPKAPVIYPIVSSRMGTPPETGKGWTVCSYDLARNTGIWRALAKGHYDLLILDEAHYCKTIDTRRTRTIFGGGREPVAEALAAISDRVLTLSGTPLPNRPREAFVLAKNLCPDSIDYMSEKRFNERFNPRKLVKADDGGKVYNKERSGRFAELQNRMRANFMVRHLKREVRPQLKMPVYDLIYFEETEAVRAALQAESMLHLDGAIDASDFELQGQIAVVRHEMGLALAPQIAGYIDMLIEGGEEKLVVFAWHLDVLGIFEKMLDDRGVLRIDGRTGAVKKHTLVKQFIQDPSKHVMIGNLLSLGTGTDGLQDVCSHGLIAEPSWVPGENIQCFDRLDRGEQRFSVQGDIAVAHGSISEKILADALEKMQDIHRALDRRIGK